MGWRSNVFEDLVANYPRGDRDAVVAAWRFVDTNMRRPNTCALRLSYALRLAIPNSMADYRGTIWTTASGATLARSSTALARQIQDKSGWDSRFQRYGDGVAPLPGYWSPEGHGIMYWKGASADKYHIDLWDSQCHLDAAFGRCMLWRPAPADTLEVWYWRLDPVAGMIFGLHELGRGGSYR